MRHSFLLIILSLFPTAYETKKPNQANPVKDDSISFRKGTFGFDLAFLKKNKEVIVLGSPARPAKVLIVKDYQGRVMTSTARGDAGNSYGWINYALIRSDSLQPHFDPFGGADRIWIGPGGGAHSGAVRTGT